MAAAPPEKQPQAPDLELMSVDHALEAVDHAGVDSFLGKPTRISALLGLADRPEITPEELRRVIAALARWSLPSRESAEMLIAVATRSQHAETWIECMSELVDATDPEVASAVFRTYRQMVVADRNLLVAAISSLADFALTPRLRREAGAMAIRGIAIVEPAVIPALLRFIMFAMGRDVDAMAAARRELRSLERSSFEPAIEAIRQALRVNAPTCTALLGCLRAAGDAGYALCDLLILSEMLGSPHPRISAAAKQILAEAARRGAISCDALCEAIATSAFAESRTRLTETLLELLAAGPAGVPQRAQSALLRVMASRSDLHGVILRRASAALTAGHGGDATSGLILVAAREFADEIIRHADVLEESLRRAETTGKTAISALAAALAELAARVPGTAIATSLMIAAQKDAAAAKKDASRRTALILAATIIPRTRADHPDRDVLVDLAKRAAPWASPADRAIAFDAIAEGLLCVSEGVFRGLKAWIDEMAGKWDASDDRSGALDARAIAKWVLACRRHRVMYPVKHITLLLLLVQLAEFRVHGGWPRVSSIEGGGEATMPSVCAVKSRLLALDAVATRAADLDVLECSHALLVLLGHDPGLGQMARPTLKHVVGVVRGVLALAQVGTAADPALRFMPTYLWHLTTLARLVERTAGLPALAAAPWGGPADWPKPTGKLDAMRISNRIERALLGANRGERVLEALFDAADGGEPVMSAILALARHFTAHLAAAPDGHICSLASGHLDMNHAIVVQTSALVVAVAQDKVARPRLPGDAASLFRAASASCRDLRVQAAALRALEAMDAISADELRSAAVTALSRTIGAQEAEEAAAAWLVARPEVRHRDLQSCKHPSIATAIAERFRKDLAAAGATAVAAAIKDGLPSIANLAVAAARGRARGPTLGQLLRSAASFCDEARAGVDRSVAGGHAHVAQATKAAARAAETLRRLSEGLKLGEFKARALRDARDLRIALPLLTKAAERLLDRSAAVAKRFGMVLRAKVVVDWADLLGGGGDPGAGARRGHRGDFSEQSPSRGGFSGQETVNRGTPLHQSIQQPQEKASSDVRKRRRIAPLAVELE